MRVGRYEHMMKLKHIIIIIIIIITAVIFSLLLFVYFFLTWFLCLFLRTKRKYIVRFFSPFPVYTQLQFWPFTSFHLFNLLTILWDSFDGARHQLGFYVSPDIFGRISLSKEKSNPGVSFSGCPSGPTLTHIAVSNTVELLLGYRSCRTA